MELLSSNGNWLCFKDDPFHQFNPNINNSSCPPGTENTTCVGTSVSGGYFKHKNELRPWNGPQTPQNNKAALPQSGIQLLSVSGHSFVMDDSVEQPTSQNSANGPEQWERSTR